MIKTRQELDTLLNTLGYQVFYNHTTKKDVVNTPYIVYLETGPINVFADNTNYYENMSYTIILFDHKRNETIESNIKTILTNNGISYSMDAPDWEEDIMLWSTQFNITI